MYPNVVTSRFRHGTCVWANDRVSVSMSTESVSMSTESVSMSTVVAVATSVCLWVALIGGFPVM